MIARIQGKLLEARLGEIVVDVHGVGYRLLVPDSTLRMLPPVGEDVVLRTYTYVREETFHLYGFLTELEKKLFEVVIGVSGIGPRLAVAILSHLTVHEFIDAVQVGDDKRLTQVPGIGKKMAARILLELKDKFKKDEWADVLHDSKSDETPSGGPMEVLDAVGALMALGYREEEARQAVDHAVVELDSSPATVEHIITLALSLLDRVG